MITAKKGNITKTFSDLSWELLGENKNGWEEVSEIKKEVKKPSAVPPPTGEVAQPSIQKVENIVTTSEVKTESIATTAIDTEAEAKKAAFIELCKSSDLKKSTIKDYFDLNEVSYKANDNLDTLIGLLHDNLNGDVEVLKTKFFA